MGKSLSSIFNSIKSEYQRRNFSPWMVDNLTKEKINQINKSKKEHEK